MNPRRRAIGRASVAGVMAAIIVTSVVALIITIQASSGRTSTLIPNPGRSSSSACDCPSYNTSSGASSSTDGQVQIVSAKLVNTTVGSHLVFDVIFKNIGNSTAYYAVYDGRTTPVYASVSPCSPSPISPATTVTDSYGCFRTISFTSLAPGGTGYRPNDRLRERGEL